MKRIIFVLLVGLFFAISNNTLGQTTYKETMGTVTGTTLIVNHNGWTYYGTLNYSGTGDVRATTPSNTTDYAEASGGANVFLTNTVGRNFIIAGINTNTFTDFDKISFGVHKSTTASNGSELIIEYSNDNGSSWTVITKPDLPTGTGTSKWYYITTSTVTFPTDTNLILRFRQNGSTPQFRIDDVTLVGNGPLPVTLSYFNSSVTKNQVTLNWATEWELNNKGFEIYRGTDKIGFVTGKNTSAQYNFIDKNLTAGIYQYKLKQIDYNGNYEYFSLNQDIIIGTPKNFDLAQNYPNPCNPKTTIKYFLPEDANVSLKIYDILGKEVLILINEYKKADYYSEEFDVSNLASGVYLYKLTAGQNAKIKKMLIIK